MKFLFNPGNPTKFMDLSDTGADISSCDPQVGLWQSEMALFRRKLALIENTYSPFLHMRSRNRSDQFEDKTLKFYCLFVKVTQGH